ncbi:MAG TPA: hypothetical protein DEP24_07845, partial [Mycobacterium sp.]|nr:hypothetical protein [Mycobacterium sp.]
MAGHPAAAAGRAGRSAGGIARVRYALSSFAAYPDAIALTPIHRQWNRGRGIEASDSVSSTSSPFGQNEWLVEEMYRKFREDPASVDRSWHEFLAGYSPDAAGGA